MQTSHQARLAENVVHVATLHVDAGFLVTQWAEIMVCLIPMHPDWIVKQKACQQSQMSKSDPESDGAVSALDDENICPSPQLTTPVTDAASGEEPLCRHYLESSTRKNSWDQGGRCDPMKMRQEKARLERRQHEEKARIEAEIRAAEAATTNEG
ncbi:hypothetical protein L3X38_022021 [Prunus dulcis]|uniref:Uncharacterized protein n=1 Tax=Prunus dulcis TaxID=3755 RepID=A0AAD4VV59_PRUDU|nr:hypothetical protein L3X38_022021 [Prunus dulcis]